MTTIEQRAQEFQDRTVLKCPGEHQEFLKMSHIVGYSYEVGFREGLRVAIAVIQGNNNQLFASKFFADAYLMGRARDAEVLQLILDGKAELPVEKI